MAIQGTQASISEPTRPQVSPRLEGKSLGQPFALNISKAGQNPVKSRSKTGQKDKESPLPLDKVHYEVIKFSTYVGSISISIFPGV